MALYERLAVPEAPVSLSHKLPHLVLSSLIFTAHLLSISGEADSLCFLPSPTPRAFPSNVMTSFPLKCCS